MISGGWGICPYFLHFLSIFVHFLLRLLPAYLISSILDLILDLDRISQEIFTAALFFHRCVMIFLLSWVNSGGLIASVLLTGFGRRATFLTLGGLISISFLHPIESCLEISDRRDM